MEQLLGKIEILPFIMIGNSGGSSVIGNHAGNRIVFHPQIRGRLPVFIRIQLCQRIFRICAVQKQGNGPAFPNFESSLFVRHTEPAVLYGILSGIVPCIAGIRRLSFRYAVLSRSFPGEFQYLRAVSVGLDPIYQAILKRCILPLYHYLE